MSLTKQLSDKENGVISKQDNQKQRIIGDYLLVKTLGIGTFGLVKLGIHQITNEKVAIKILEKERIQEVADVERVAREIHILKLIRHRHVIQLYEIIETKKHIFLVMEFADGGELFDYIVENKRLQEMEACKFFQELISGIEYLHQLNIVHRDLKPENLLLGLNKSIKIVDFGLSNTYKPGEKLKTACGSPCYAAPEMIAGNYYDSLMVDLWSCGVILFATICGQLPFEDQNTSALYKKILSGEYIIPNFISDLGTSFLRGILNIDPKKRFSIQQIKQHPWFNIYKRTNPIPNGIMIGYNRIPIDDQIVRQLVNKGFGEDYIKKCLDATKHNNVTTAYFLLLKRHLMKGGTSQADINSSNFDQRLLDPTPRPEKPPISGFLDTEWMRTLKHNRSGSCQVSQKSHTQQNRGMSVPQVFEEKQTFKQSIQQNNYLSSCQSIADQQLDFAERNKAQSFQIPGNRKMPTDAHAQETMNRTTFTSTKRSSHFSPTNNKLLVYLKNCKKQTPTAVRGNSQQKMPFQVPPKSCSHKNNENKRDSMKINNLIDTTNIEQKKKPNFLERDIQIHELQIPNTTKTSTVPYQLWLQLNSRKGSRDYSAPNSTKTSVPQKKKSNTKTYVNQSFHFDKKDRNIVF